MSEETIFGAALALPPNERAPFLDQACGGDATLKCSGAGVPPAFGAYRPCICVGETPVDRGPKARVTIFRRRS